MNRYIRRLGLAIILALACSSAIVAEAATHSWNVGNGNWSVAGNWSPVGVPGAGDTVNIVDSDGVSRTITYDYIQIGPGITLVVLTLDLTNYTVRTLPRCRCRPTHWRLVATKSWGTPAAGR